MRVTGLSLTPRTRLLRALLIFAWVASPVLFGGRMHPQAGNDVSIAKAQALTRAAREARFLSGRRMGAQGLSAQALGHAKGEHHAMYSGGNSSNLSATWTAVGPAQVASLSFGNVTGRVTAVTIDPADRSGNTVYLGTTGGGVWKSTNAAGAAASVTFIPLTDTLPVFTANAGTSVIPSLSIGALGIDAGNGVLLAGTGDPNDATDSYYGSGLLRSTDGGATWTLIQESYDGVAGNHNFTGLSFAGFAFSSVNPSLMVAAVSQASEGDLVNAADTTNSVKGLYFSTDAGATWQMSVLMDGSQTVQTPQPTGGNGGGNAATSVVWNGTRQRFYAAVRFHGYYESSDGQTWRRLSNQPGAGLTASACPANAGGLGSSGCPIFRGVLAVQEATGDTFALTVDGRNLDQGLYQDVCAASGAGCVNSLMLFGNRLDSSPLEAGGGNRSISQADYSLSLRALAAAADTILYAGTIDLYRCSLAAGCSLRNTTNAQNGCANPAGIAPAQHAIAALSVGNVPLIYLGNDGGIYRSSDGANELAAPCSADDATHFQNLNSGLGSLAEVNSFAQDPTNPSALIAGLGALGTAGTGAAATSNAWAQLALGEGGTVAIDQSNPLLWYLSAGAGVNIARCTKGPSCTAADFIATTVGETQVANDIAAIHAPWIVDPGLNANLLIGTCRAWRGPADNGALWSTSNEISRPFGAPSANGCSSTFPVVRSLAAGGPTIGSSSAQNAGSQVLYAGLAGALDGGQGFGGDVFAATAAQLASSATIWSDLAKSPVTNDSSGAGIFNPGRFDVSSLHVDLHDASGMTIYATVMGFAGNGVNAPHVYRSNDGGAHWANISSNLPNAPANSVIVDPNDANTLYVALDTGVYVTTQVSSCVNVSLNCWSVYGSALPNAPVVELQAAAGMATSDGRLGELRAATYGRGIWQIPLLTAASAAAPSIALDPSALTFASQQAGSASPSQNVKVTNTGSANLIVSLVSTNGDFTESDDCMSSPIAPNASCTVSVSFLPSASGSRTGILTVYGNVSGGQASAALTGTGTPPAAIVLTPSALLFSGTSVGAASGSQNITISNTGSGSENIQTPVIAGDFKLAANTCGQSLPANTGCTVSVVFMPTSSGTRRGILTVSDDAGTQVARFTGVGTTPATDALFPLGLAFSAQELSTRSASQQITLVNAGGVALTLIAAQVTSGDFNVVSDCGNSLAARSTCTFAVTFVPKRLGQQGGVLTIADQFRTQTVQLGGYGVAPPGVSILPQEGFSFGAAGLGTSTTGQTITLTNNGGSQLTIADLTVTGDFFAIAGSNTCGTSVAPGGVCTVQIGFSPTLPGLRQGVATFTDSAPASPQKLQLAGTGIDLVLVPDGVTTMTIASGQTATYGLLLRSSAGSLGDVNFSCSGVPALSTCTVNPAQPSLGTTTVMTVTVATGLADASVKLPGERSNGARNWLAVLLPFSGILLLRARKTGLVRLIGLLSNLIVGVTLITCGGCGVARTVPGNGTGTPSAPVITPSGTYTLLIAASSANLVQTTQLTLIVR